MKKLLFTTPFLLLPLFAFLQVNVDANEIIDKLNKGEAVHYENVTVSGDIDFRLIEDKEKERDIETVFNDHETYKYHVNAPIKFTNCTFTGSFIAYYSDDVKDELHIALFHENVLIDKCTFKKDFLVKIFRF